MSKENVAVPMIPKQWPGAFGLYEYSKRAVLLNLTTLLVLWLISFGVSIIFDENFFGQAVGFVVSSLASAAIAITYLAAVSNKHIDFQQAIKKAWPLLPHMLLLTILIIVIAIFSLVLLVVPFFIIMPRMALASYFLVDKKLDAIESLKASWKATQQHVGKIWGVIGASILMILIAVTIVGIPISVYLLVMYSAALAVLYKFIEKN